MREWSIYNYSVRDTSWKGHWDDYWDLMDRILLGECRAVIWWGRNDSAGQEGALDSTRITVGLAEPNLPR